MDLMTLSGITIGFGAIGYVLHHGQMIEFILNLEAFILIFGGTLGSVLITYPWSVIKQVPRGMAKALVPPKRLEPGTLVDILVNLAERARRDGPETLAKTAGAMPHPTLEMGLRLLGAGLDYDVVRDKLEQDKLLTRQRHLRVSAVFRSAGTFAPIFGLLGTLIGVVQVLRNITDPSVMGSSMAIAMTASFYGIFSANFFFLPVAGKLNFYTEEEVLAKELITKGILAIHQGEVPWMVAQKLEDYLAYHLRKKERMAFKRAVAA